MVGDDVVGVLVLVMVVELGSLATCAARLAVADAAACAAEAADNDALATSTGADGTVTCADAVALAGAAAVAEATSDALGDAEMIVSDPGPVSGTGTGRVARLLGGELEPMKEPPPDPPSHKPNPMRPTHTAPANNHRFGWGAAPA